MMEVGTIQSAIDLDAKMRTEGWDGFCIHSGRDVLIAGLTAELSALSFTKVCQERRASCVIEDAEAMVPLISNSAKRLAKTFTVFDDYTTRFGYSTGQLGNLSEKAGAESVARAIARGGPPNFHFRNVPGPSLGSSRAPLRMQLVKDAARVSRYYRNKWLRQGRPRVTEAFRTDCEWVRAPFTLAESLPCATDSEQIRLATWETALRGVEEHLMLSVFGCMPNVTWARILAKVLERAETAMGEFDVDNYRQWAHSPLPHAHTVGPGKLGCPWRGGGGRILPKGAAGISPSKEVHDDDNAVLSLGCWTALTEADTPTNLSFLINGFEVFLRASAPRNVLFMGYIPHETKPAHPSQPATMPRVHHSAFAKPEAEHLAACVLSNLACYQGGGKWSVPCQQSDRGLLRLDAFSEESMGPILRKGSKEVRDAVCLI
jgi:hypothetical protein